MSREIEAGDEVFCECCKTTRRAKWVDFGYGVTEFWGSVSNHVDLCLVCDYCEAEEIVHPDEVEEEIES